MNSGNQPFDSKSVEEALIHQVSIFGLTTRLVWCITPGLSDVPVNFITKTLRSLVVRQILEAHPLHHGRFYFSLTKKAAKELATQNTSGGPFNERDKLRSYARLLLSTMHIRGTTPVPRTKLLRSIGESAIGLPDHFMFHQLERKLYSVRVDAAIHAFPSRMAQQLRTVVYRSVKLPVLCELIRQKRFEIVLVTCTVRRKEAILKHFRSYDRVGSTPIRSIVIPELLPLITSVPIGGVIYQNTK